MMVILQTGDRIDVMKGLLSPGKWRWWMMSCVVAGDVGFVIRVRVCGGIWWNSLVVWLG